MMLKKMMLLTTMMMMTTMTTMLMMTTMLLLKRLAVDMVAALGKKSNLIEMMVLFWRLWRQFYCAAGARCNGRLWHPYFFAKLAES